MTPEDERFPVVSELPATRRILSLTSRFLTEEVLVVVVAAEDEVVFFRLTEIGPVRPSPRVEALEEAAVE